MTFIECGRARRRAETGDADTAELGLVVMLSVEDTAEAEARVPALLTVESGSGIAGIPAATGLVMCFCEE